MAGPRLNWAVPPYCQIDLFFLFLVLLYACIALQEPGCHHPLTRSWNCKSFLTLGQYLQPDTSRYLPVDRYLPPSEFDELGRMARQMGFEQVASGPFVRSSYHAREMAEDAPTDT